MGIGWREKSVGVRVLRNRGKSLGGERNIECRR